MTLDSLDFAGRRVLVTGGASGMGAATTAMLVDLGATVDVFDVKQGVATTGAVHHHVDLRDPESIDRGLSELDPGIDVLINCAGLPQTFPACDVIACNIAGLRHLTERVVPTLRSGGAIVSVSSAAGGSWRKHSELLGELLDTPDMGHALQWFEAHPEIGDPYVFSKMAVNLYTLRRAPQLASDGIRMNAVCPGNTITPMSPEFVKHVGADAINYYHSVAGVAATPEQQANVIVFLASDLASYVNGVLLEVDGGFAAAALTRQLPPL